MYIFYTVDYKNYIWCCLIKKKKKEAFYKKFDQKRLEVVNVINSRAVD